MLGQLRKAIERSYVRERVPNLNRLSRARKERSRPRPNSVFAQFSVVCMFNWMLGQLRKGCGKVVCSWKSSEFESAEPCEENGKNLVFNPIQCSRNSQSCVCLIGCSAN